MAEALFQLDRVSAAYGQQVVLHDLELGLAGGLFHGLLGPNGSGKTTLLDLIIGNRRPTAGRVRYRGRELSAYAKLELARELALVPQEFWVDFEFTVLEIVMMGRHPHIPRFASPTPADLALVEATMRELGILELQERSLAELSGGEKQRVVAARALVQETPVLILDEATSNLDIRHTIDIMRVVQRRVRERGHTVIAAIHDLNLAAAYCDRVILLDRGRVVAVGPTAEVITAANLQQVYGVEAETAYSDFSQARQIVYKYGPDKKYPAMPES